MVNWTCQTTTAITHPAVAHMSATTNKAAAATSSEIDDIFSRKVAIPKTVQRSSSKASNFKQKKQRNKRSQTQLADPKRSTPEIVLDPSILDPSIQLSHASMSKLISHDRPVRPVPPSKKRKLVETKQGQETFRDSRGTVPRKRFP
jgi:hypothetical protein